MKICKIAYLTTATILGSALVSCTSTRNHNSAFEADEENSSLVSGTTLHPIYFDFDRSNIRSDQQKKATAMANALKDYPNTKVQIQGNTDDRGSVEYNLALGTKRAQSLRSYLVSSGVAKENIDIISYGKERPAIQGNDEDSYSKNRRDDVIVISE